MHVPRVFFVEFENTVVDVVHTPPRTARFPRRREREMKSEPFDGSMDRDDSDCEELADVGADLETMFAFWCEIDARA